MSKTDKELAVEITTAWVRANAEAFGSEMTKNGDKAMNRLEPSSVSNALKTFYEALSSLETPKA